MDLYELDLDRLLESADSIDQSASELQVHAAKLSNIIANITNSWQNSDGRDIESIEEGFRKCMDRINTKICPTVYTLTNAVRQLAESTQMNQSRTMD